ncbi:MAG: phosphoribosylanthranilate isomerase [Alicyclobacillus sp.]|nr:phosphoribosylanthranilate isomerase [Alicyclobacillus sp.]
MSGRAAVQMKICGLQPGDDLSFTAAPEISHVGFIFVPTSRRYVRPSAVRPMVEQLPASCRAVGVFVNADLDAVRTAARTSGVEVLQLHGGESPAFCDALRADGFVVWKALSVPTDAQTPDDVRPVVDQALAFAGCVDGVLFDAAPPATAERSVTGGHGRIFTWRLLAGALEASGWWASGFQRPQIWVAGGIRPENAAHLLAQFRPDGIDVSSGVEVEGRKSLRRIDELREAVRNLVR